MNKLTIFLLLPALLLMLSCATRPKEMVITVTGEISPEQMGTTLEHEHILVDFTRQPDNQPEIYRMEEAVACVLPHLEKLKAYGVKTFVECTPIYVGRDVRLLKRLSEETGLQILTNTGFYGAQNNRFIPEHVLKMTPEMISTFWIAEFEQGIEGTGIRPGFIKIGVDRKPLSDFHAILARAAAIAHKATGLTIMAHTGPAVAAFQQLEILKEEGVSPEAFIWTHASNEKDGLQLVKAARMGAWVSLDKYGWDGALVESCPQILKLMKEEGVLNKVLISHDAGWFDPGQPEQPFKPYTPVFEELIPNLKKQGFTDDDIDLLLVKNPAKAFTVKKRLINQ
ncbi:MAG: hypothetical protein A2W90_23145 [Bacteroidetes bacterium GWF2_42_66]|nr:MAG: hypothetical protein A2W92_02960 [Bacteroidetes bacterium GWA2_42_15]OFX99503.1 MAG: hypothetical protein A2W89_12830 [Bacteroidetes bacterium GWE2_42_39]OFY47034.1 MAG: hypothetical protein A2W90_23145 [Bacteroidetes bacterium GWF2_42_66]